MRRRYKFTDRNQSKQGIVSSVIGMMALLLTGIIQEIPHYGFLPGESRQIFLFVCFVFLR